MIEIYTAEQAAVLLNCAAKTVEDLARRGELPGIKPGGAWVFPAGALRQRLDDLALAESAERRHPAKAKAVQVGRVQKMRPVLVNLQNAGAASK